MPDTEQAERPATAPSEAVTKPARTGGNVTGLIVKTSIIAAVVMVAVLGAYLVTSKVLRPMLASKPDTEAPKQEAVAPEPEKKSEAKGEGGEGGGEGESKGTLFEVDNIIVNPASTAGSRFLSCSVAFDIASPEDLRVFEANQVKIRDALITILAARTVDELGDARLREPLRRQILSRVNKLTSPATAKAIYFKDFVLQ